LTGDLKVAKDPKASGGQLPGYPDCGGRAIESANDEGAQATYDVAVPGAGTYELCLRIFVPGPAYYLTVAVDQAAPVKRFLPQWPTYYTYNHEPILLDLSAGKHQLTFTFGGAGTKLDLLELIPRKRGVSSAVAQRVAP
jgi:hypothetical protein